MLLGISGSTELSRLPTPSSLLLEPQEENLHLQAPQAKLTIAAHTKLRVHSKMDQRKGSLQADPRNLWTTYFQEA